MTAGNETNPKKRLVDGSVPGSNAKRTLRAPKQELCLKCRCVPWSQLEQKVPEGMHGKLVMNISASRAELGRSSCPVCRLMFLITPDSFESGEWQLRALSSCLPFDYGFRWLRRERRLSIDKSVPQCTIFMTIAKSQGTKDHSRLKWRRGGCLGFGRAEGDEAKCGPRLILQQSIDYTVINHWITECKKTHRQHCSPTPVNTLRNLRVIDCSTKSVVKAPKDCRYAALSYVWGPSSTNQSGEFAPVVNDGISVVLNLGLKYLWVDKHCIEQDNQEDLAEQVACMDQIYAGAILTIIAAAGNNDQYGLPGVSGRARISQEVADIGHTQLIQIFPHVSTTLSSATWTSRGWTYQEGIFSNRRLIFTDNQVSYLCNTMHCAETADMPPEKLRRKLDHPFEAIAPSMGTKSDHQAIKIYIMEYSKRHLSNDSDALNAILGIFNSLRSFRKGSLTHLFGIPVALGPEILISLGWYRNESSSRRSNFPSWSWAGWKGHVRMTDPDVRQSIDCAISMGEQSLEQYSQTIRSTVVDLGNTPKSLLVKAQAIDVSLEWKDWAAQTNSLSESFSQRSQKSDTGFLTGFHAMLRVSANTTAWVYAYLDKEIHQETSITGLLGLVLGRKAKHSVTGIILLERVGDCYERVGILRYRNATGTQDSSGSIPYIILVDEDGNSQDEIEDLGADPLWLSELKEVAVNII